MLAEVYLSKIQVDDSLPCRRMIMDHDDVTGRLASYPPKPPRRHFTASDVSLMIGSGLLLSLGSFAAGVGHMTGLLFSIVAALGVISVRSSRIGRLDEPALRKWTGPLGIGVSVFIFVYTFGMWRNSVLSAPSSLLLSAIPLFVYVAYLLVMFLPRR